MRKALLTAVSVVALAGVVTACDTGTEKHPFKAKGQHAQSPQTKQAKADQGPHLTTAQEQAVGTAQDYLDGQSFSRLGLIGQLVYEGFSRTDATFAVNHIQVDWNRQAAKTARDYLDGQHFSRTGLIGQLVYEKFTRAQAIYGVNQTGL
jgi:Host cell surface-exposed lipoprotein